MAFQSKLKANTLPTLLGITGGLLILITMIFVTGQMESKTADQVKGGIWGFFALIQLFVWLRTKNTGYFVWMFACVAIAISYLTGYKGMYFLIPVAALLIAYLYLLIGRRMRWRYRDILELAAKPVEETRDGFTPRPFPAGKADYTKEELVRFGKFLSKNLIAFPFVEKESLYLMINGTSSFLFRKPKIQNDTFIAFDFAGNVSVNIAKKDYRKYKADLTFDQLCASLGSLFKTFLKFYQEGNKDRIMSLIEEHIPRVLSSTHDSDPSIPIKRAKTEI